MQRKWTMPQNPLPLAGEGRVRVGQPDRISSVRTRLSRAGIPTLLSLALLFVALPAWAQAPAGPTLSAVRARGILECSASLGVPGFGIYDKQGVFQGMDADSCRAI